MTKTVRDAWRACKARDFSLESLENLARALEGDARAGGVRRLAAASNYPLRVDDAWWWLLPREGQEALSMHQVPADVFDRIRSHPLDGCVEGACTRVKRFEFIDEAMQALIDAYAEADPAAPSPPAHPVTYPPAFKVGDSVHWHEASWREYRCGTVVTPGEAKTAVWASDFGMGRCGVTFVDTPLLVPGFRSASELQKMTAERHGEDN